MTEVIRKATDKIQEDSVSKYIPFKYRYPSAITVEIMDTCNLKCRHCHLQFQPNTKRGFMAYDLFKEIIDRISPLFKKVNRLNFASIEALFHPRIFDMFDLIRKYNENINIYINTNGMLLDNSCVDNLLKRKIYDIHISLDGCKKETVESFKTGVDFNRVIRNFKRLQEKGRDKFNITANFVLYRNNMYELSDYLDFCKALGAISVNVIGFIAYTPQMADYCLYSERGIKKIDHLLKSAAQKAKNIGVKFRHHGTKIKARGCGYASDLMYINKKGDIVPCSLLSKKTQMFFLGRIGTTESISWGNVLNEEPFKIWTSKASVNFRRLLQKKQLPKECSLCAIGYKVIC